MPSWDDAVPCSNDPEAWFGYDTDHGRRTPEQQRKTERAKLLCQHQCPFAERRRCARTALDTEAAHGIWAGVELPLRKLPAEERRARLAVARGQLHDIATAPDRVAAYGYSTVG